MEKKPRDKYEVPADNVEAQFVDEEQTIFGNTKGITDLEMEMVRWIAAASKTWSAAAMLQLSKAQAGLE